MCRDGTGPGCHGFVLKQLQHLGLSFHWRSTKQLPTTHAYIYTSDAGPDQIGCRGIIKQIVHMHMSESSTSYFFDNDCLKHQLQLVVKGLLIHSDRWAAELGMPFKYFGTLAKWMNVWRDSGFANQVFHVAKRRYGNMLALKYAHSRPSRCLSGMGYDDDGLYDSCYCQHLAYIVGAMANAH